MCGGSHCLRRSLASSTAASPDAGSSSASGRPRIPPRHQRPAASRSTSSHSPCSTASALLGPAAHPMLSKNGGVILDRPELRRRQISAGSSIVVSFEQRCRDQAVEPRASPPAVPDSTLSRKPPPLPLRGLQHLSGAACDQRLVARFELREILDALADARFERGAHRQAHAAHARERRLGMIRRDHARVHLAAEEYETRRFRRAQLEHARELRRRPQAAPCDWRGGPVYRARNRTPAIATGARRRPEARRHASPSRQSAARPNNSESADADELLVAAILAPVSLARARGPARSASGADGAT